MGLQLPLGVNDFRDRFAIIYVFYLKYKTLKVLIIKLTIVFR